MQTEDEVIAAVKKAAEELGRAPTLDWLLKYEKVSKYSIRKHFSDFRKCLEAAGLYYHRQGYELNDKELFTDWAGVVRLLGKVPSIVDYRAHGHYSDRPMNRRFRAWSNLPAGMPECARKEGQEEGGKDGRAIVTRHSQ